MSEKETVLTFKFGRELTGQEKEEVISDLEVTISLLKERGATDYDWEEVEI